MFYFYINYSADEHRPRALKSPVSLSYVWVKQALFGSTLGQKGSKIFTWVSESRVQYIYSADVQPVQQALVRLSAHFSSSLFPLW